MNDNERILSQGLAEECRKLHRGESIDIRISHHADANAIKGIESAIRDLYRGMFGGDLRIESMKRDEYQVLHFTVGKKGGE